MSKSSFAKQYVVSATGVAYAFSLGLLDGRNRGLIRQISRHFGYTAHPARTLPVIDADSLADPRVPIVLAAAADAADGNVSLYELITLNRLAATRRPRSIFEIGTLDGRTTLNLALNTDPETVLFTLDLPPGVPTRFKVSRADRTYVDKPESGERFIGTDVAPRIHQLYGDSAAFDFSSHSAELVFVDGAHSYDFVMSDSLNALALLRGRPGIILWHDDGEWPDVTRALNELRRTDSRFARLANIANRSLAILEAR